MLFEAMSALWCSVGNNYQNMIFRAWKFTRVDSKTPFPFLIVGAKG